MNDINRKLIVTIASVLALMVVVVGVTFSYYVASSNGTNNISGGIRTFDVSLSVSTIKASTNLIPLDDNLVNTAISKNSNKCIDNNSLEVCSLYQITLTNTGASQSLYGYLTTVSSTYTTSNLKYQLFTLSGNTYTAVTDAIVINNTANTDNYMVNNSSNVQFTINTGTSSSPTTSTYYLAIWLSNTNSSQSSDYSKSFVGTIGFDSVNGKTLTSNFITS